MKKIFVLGDSISIHYGPYLEKYIQGKMKYSRKDGTEDAESNLDLALGANGGDSSHVLTYLKKLLSTNKIDADFFLLNCGLHDIKRSINTNSTQISTKQYESNLNAIIDIFSKLESKLVWIRTTPVDEKIHNSISKTFLRYQKDYKEYNNIADKIMSKNKTPIIDLCSFTKNIDKELYCDHIHFHPSIREKQAAFIAGWLNANLNFPIF